MKLKEYLTDIRIIAGLIGAVLIIFILTGLFIISPPRGFPLQEIISVEEGLTLSETADFLKEQNVIRSPLLFKVMVILYPGENHVISGDYFLEEKMGLLSVAYRINKGLYHIDPIKITIPEGLDNKEVLAIYEKSLPMIDVENFLQLASDKEGYLFPDTYYLLPNADEEDIIEEMNENFWNKAGPMETLAVDAGLNFNEIIIMASLLEKEARKMETRKRIAGILWKRLEIDMPLQVDATFLYFLGKNSLELTLEDLEYDSPYNTYKYKGLPPGPISNPGLDSIYAAIYYEETPYLFYLSDSNGITHYAEDFEEHKLNKQKYLR